jgi:O-antigen/teichoic acid export membrane protein
MNEQRAPGHPETIRAEFMNTILRKCNDPRTLALIDQSLLSGTNFITLLWVSRHVDANAFGQFSLAALVLLFLANVHRAVITQQLNLLGANDDPERLRVRIAVSLWAHLLLVPLSVALLAILSWRYFPEPRLFAGAAAYAVCFMLQETIRRYYYTVGRIRSALLNDFISYGGQLIAIFVMSRFMVVDGEVTFFIMAATSLAAFMFGVPQIDIARSITLRYVREILGQHLASSGWLLLTVLALWGATQLHPFLLAPLGPGAIAVFSASRNPLNVIGVAVQSVGNLLPIRAAGILGTRGPAALRKHLVTTTLHALIASFVIVIAMQLTAPLVLKLLYGGRYDDATPILRVLSFGIVFALIGTVLGAYALALNDARSNFLSNLAATAFTFTGGLLLIHIDGLMGAAIGGCLSVAIATVVQGVFVWRRLRVLEQKDDSIERSRTPDENAAMMPILRAGIAETGVDR